MKIAKGRRSVVYIKDGVAVKTSKPDATNRLNFEAQFLVLLNKHGIGPNLINCKDGKLRMEFIDGILIEEFCKKFPKKKKGVIVDVLIQCRTIDKLKINKEEMHHPTKHIIVRKDKPVMIDFERCKYTIKPKNVTQFCQFIPRLMEIDVSMLRNAALTYSTDMNPESFSKIVELVKNN